MECVKGIEPANVSTQMTFTPKRPALPFASHCAWLAHEIYLLSMFQEEILSDKEELSL